MCPAVVLAVVAPGVLVAGRAQRVGAAAVLVAGGCRVAPAG